MNPKLEKAIILMALVVPFGLVALGIWKAYDLYKNKEKNESTETK